MSEPFCVYPVLVALSLITEKEIELLRACDFYVEVDKTRDECSLYGEEIPDARPISEVMRFSSNEEIGLLSNEEKDLYERENFWVEILRNIIVRSREAGTPIKIFVVEGSFTCTEPGGYACVITENEEKWTSTSAWIDKTVGELGEKSFYFTW